MSCELTFDELNILHQPSVSSPPPPPCRKTIIVLKERTLATPVSASLQALSLELATPSLDSALAKEESLVVSVTAVTTPSPKSLPLDVKVCQFI